MGRGECCSSVSRVGARAADYITCGALVWMPQFGCQLLDFVLVEEASIDNTGMQSFRLAFVVGFATI